MKRSAELTPLSHDHHQSLFVAVQLKRAADAAPGKAFLDFHAGSGSHHFEIEETEWIEHEFGPAVFGASLVNFPKTLTPRKDVKYSPRYNPVSSFALGR